MCISSPMKLFIWLGNPGKEYEHTRHNVGWLVLDQLCEQEGFTSFLPQKKFQAEVANGIVGKRQVIAAKPQTFMNRSGTSVQEIMHYYKIEPKDILIFQDDIDLDAGKIRLKFNWASGGHNGIKDIVEKIGTDKFWRLKFGVGRPTHPEHDVSDHVLGGMSSTEKKYRRDQASSIREKVEEYLKNTG